MKYHANIVNNNKSLNEFNNYLDKIKYKKGFVAIDLEFNNRNAALIQLNFVIDNSKNIWIIEPNNKLKNKFISNILINSNFIKILHGSESLDIPYMLKYIGNKTMIVKFINQITDTRFICEYYNILHSEHNKCSLYDALLLFNVIDKKKYEKLNNIPLKLGKIWKIKWNINKLEKNILDYVVYDVYYLVNLYKNLWKIIGKDIIKINKLVSFTFLEKFGITNYNNNLHITDDINNIYEQYILQNNDIIKYIQFTKKYYPLFIKNNIINISKSIK